MKKLIRKENILILIIATWGLGFTFSDQDVAKYIEEFKRTAYGAKLLSDHSEKDLTNLLLFYEDPSRYFPAIRTIENIADLIDGYDYYLWDTGHLERGFSAFSNTYFREIDSHKVAILTFLLLSYRNYGGINAEAVVVTYADRFRSHPTIFIKEIENDKNWRLIVDALAMEWSVFKEGVAKLGNSEFDKEFKAYVRKSEEEARKKVV
jgi:hypothetical protein